jgi:hypothetical protein
MGDTCGYHLTGQSDQHDRPPERQLTIHIDPKGRLFGANGGQQLVSSLLRIDVERSTITLLDSRVARPPGGEAVVTSITPNTGRTNSKVQIAIDGAGCAPGMAASFEGGSGPPPGQQRRGRLPNRTRPR